MHPTFESAAHTAGGNGAAHKTLPATPQVTPPVAPTVAVLGATGKLGLQVAQQVLQRGWSLSVAVRSRQRLAPALAQHARCTEMDLLTATLDDIAAFAAGHDALICCAGYVGEGPHFVLLIDRVIS